VARLGVSGFTPVEKDTTAFLKKGWEGLSGNGSAGGINGKQGFYNVLDLTGKEYRVSSTAGGVERMGLLNGLVRELERTFRPEKRKKYPTTDLEK
jgi:hypothetical protein